MFIDTFCQGRASHALTVTEKLCYCVLPLLLSLDAFTISISLIKLVFKLVVSLIYGL